MFCKSTLQLLDLSMTFIGKARRRAWRAFLASILAMSVFVGPADAYRENMLCIEILEFMGAPPAGGNRSLWLTMAGFYSGMAQGVEILHPEARGEYETVRARLKATCEAYPVANVGAVLRRFAREVSVE